MRTDQLVSIWACFGCFGCFSHTGFEKFSVETMISFKVSKFWLFFSVFGAFLRFLCEKPSKNKHSLLLMPKDAFQQKENDHPNSQLHPSFQQVRNQGGGTGTRRAWAGTGGRGETRRRREGGCPKLRLGAHTAAPRHIGQTTGPTRE